MKIKNEKYIMPKTCIFANNIVGYIFVTNIVPLEKLQHKITLNLKDYNETVFDS